MPKSLLAAALAVVLLAGPARAADTLNVGTAAQALLFIPLDVGLANGAFQKLGLDVHKLNFSGAAKLNQGMVSGAADIGLTGSTDFAYQVKGTPAKTVAGIVNSASDLGLTVGNDISSAAQLKGKRIGVTQPGTLTYWLAKEFARHQGWGPDGVATVSIGGEFAAQVAAILGNEVTGVMSNVAVGLTLADQHRGRLLVNANSFVPGFMANSIIASNRLIAAQPDALRRFLVGWFQTVAWIKAHPAETVAIGSKVLGPPPRIVREELDTISPTLSLDGRITPRQLHQIAEAIAEIGLVTGTPNLAPYYDARFLPPPAQKAAAR